MGAGNGSHGSHPQGGILLVDLPGVILPDENVAFSQIQKRGNVLLPDDVTPPESGALEAVPHGGDIVAEGHANGLFNIDFFHDNQPFNRSIFSGGRATETVSVCRHLYLGSSQIRGAALSTLSGRSVTVREKAFSRWAHTRQETALMPVPSAIS